MAACDCRHCTHPAWKKRCVLKGGRAMAKDKKLWESSPSNADGWALLQLCGYGADSASATWRRIKPGTSRYVPWPEAVEALRDLAKTRSRLPNINASRDRVLKELEAHFALAPKEESSSSASSDSSGAATTTSSTRTPANSSDDAIDVDSDAPPVQGQRLDLPPELATLLGRVQLPKVRATPNQEYALMDIGMAVTGKNASEAARDVRIVCERYPEVEHRMLDFKFAGQGQRVPTKVGNLAKVIEYIMLLPGLTAARIRMEASKILVRYLGGDLKLIDEVRNMRRVQEHLAEVDPTDWRRAFGDAVEQDAAAAEPPLCNSFQLRIHDLDVAGDKSLGDLYLMCASDPSGHLVAWKVGRSTNPMQRAQNLDGDMRRAYGRNWVHGVVDIVRGAGCLESLVHRKLSDLAMEGPREYFHDAEDFRDRFLEHCRQAASLWSEHKKRGRDDSPEDEHDLAMKRRREEIKLSHEELAAQEKAFLLHERSTRLHLETQKRLTEINVSAQERLVAVQERLAALHKN